MHQDTDFGGGDLRGEGEAFGPAGGGRVPEGGYHDGGGRLGVVDVEVGCLAEAVDGFPT